MIWLLILVVVAVFVGDVWIYNMIPTQIPQAIMMLVVVLGCVILGAVIYVFPLLARFDNTTKNMIKNAFILSIVKLPYTLLFILLMITPVLLAVFVLEILPVVIMVGVSLPAYLISVMLVRIFRKLEPVEPVLENNEEAEEIEI